MDLPLDSIICHDVTQPFPLPDQCIDVVVTSPPYWGLRDYGIKSIFGGDPNCKHKWSEEKTGLTHENRNFQKGSQEEVVGQKGTTWIRKYDAIPSGFCQICGAWLGQLGLEPHPQMFIDHLVLICREIKRVLKKSGSFYLNLGDTYFGGGQGGGNKNAWKGKSKKYGHIKLKADHNWLQPKQLMLIPARIAIALQDDGWILRNDIIWHKCLYSKTNILLYNMIKERYDIKQVNELKVGNLLPTQNREGKQVWVEITNINENGIRELYQITLTNGKKVIATKDHRFPVKMGAWHKKELKYIKMTIKPLSELKTGDKLYLCEHIKTEAPEGSTKDYKNGYFVGFYLAEGSWIKRKRYNKGNALSENALKRWTKEKSYSSINEYISNRENICGIQLSCGILDRKRGYFNNFPKFKFSFFEYGNTLHVKTYDGLAIKLIKEYVRGDTAKNKHLNTKVFNESIRFIEGAIQGFLDGDGCFDSKHNRYRVRICNNEQLTKDIEHLCILVGKSFRRHKNIKVKLNNKEYETIGFAVQTYDKRTINHGLICQAIRNIEKIGSGKVYDISLKPLYGTLRGKSKKIQGRTKQDKLDKWNGLYFLANGIWTHNSNSMPSSVKDRLNNTFEHVFHFVKSRKYFYDLDLIREPHKESSLERAKYGFNLTPRAWEQEVIPASGGKKVNIDCHPAGKNPGDMLTYDSKYKDINYGQTPQGFTRVQSIEKERKQSREDAKRLYPNDPKKQQEYINYIHDHGGHPVGPNPGDVIKQGMHHGSSLSNKATYYEKPIVKLDPKGANPCDIVKNDIAVGRIGNFSYNDPLHTKEYHPSGKNPGDFWKTNPEYIVGHLAEKIRDFYDAHPDADLGWLDDVIRDIVLADPDDFNYPGDFWSLTTQPFTGYNPDLEHFAVFPEDLVLNPLKASCPKEICRKCGKPRIRITKLDNPSKTDFDRDNLVKATEVQKTSNPQSIKSLHRNPSPDGKTKGVYYSGKTVGWSDCGCNAGFDAGVVLDPFCGRGTVGKVAKSLGLHYILFDAKPEYCELAHLYIGGQKYKLHRDQSKLNV